MQVKYSSDKELVEEVKKKLVENEGYCPCRTQRNEDTKCMCKEFREQIANENFSGECHCGLYVVTRD